jgi:hypothetical protein
MFYYLFISESIWFRYRLQIYKPLDIDWVPCQMYVPIIETVKIISKEKYIKNR